MRECCCFCLGDGDVKQLPATSAHMHLYCLREQIDKQREVGHRRCYEEYLERIHKNELRQSGNEVTK